MVKTRMLPRDVALAAVFAALSWIVSEFVPGIPIIGASGSKISFDAALAPIYGIIIGPYLGFFAALIGGLVAAGSLFTILTSFCTGISAFVAGMLANRRTGFGRTWGWIFSAIVIAVLIAGWYSTDIGRQAPFYPIPHLMGLAIVLVARGWTSKKIEEEASEEVSPQARRLNTQSLAWGIISLTIGVTCYFTYLDLAGIAAGLGVFQILSFLSYSMVIVGLFSLIYGLFSWIRPGFVTALASACYCGLIADHMLGNLIFIGMIDIVAEGLKGAPSQVVAGIFLTVLPVSVAERVLFTAIATTIGLALLPALRKAGIRYSRAK